MKHGGGCKLNARKKQGVRRKFAKYCRSRKSPSDFITSCPLSGWYKNDLYRGCPKNSGTAEDEREVFVKKEFSFYRWRRKRAFPPPPPFFSGAGVQGALGEIHLLIAAGAGVLFVELVREDFQLLPAFGAFAFEGLQVFELLKARAMLWCGHGNLL
jgi:hypothetical protein